MNERNELHEPLGDPRAAGERELAVARIAVMAASGRWPALQVESAIYELLEQAEAAAAPRSASELVTCSLRDPDRVVHLKHEECAVEQPHLIADCGRFVHAASPGADPRSAAPVGWQPIETAPKDRDIWLSKPNGESIVGRWGDYCRLNVPGFTLWQELPDPPALSPAGVERKE